MLRGKPGVQVKVEKKATKGALTVALGSDVLWSAAQRSLRGEADVVGLEAAVRAALGGGKSATAVDVDGGSDASGGRGFAGKKMAPTGTKKEQDEFAALMAAAAAAGGKRKKVKK